MMAKRAASARCHALRLEPGEDLRAGLEAFVAEHDIVAAAVLTCVGSLRPARLRLAGGNEIAEIEGPLEIVSCVATLSKHGCHVHIAVADEQGRVSGGHLSTGSRVYTTAEIVLAELPHFEFRREPDAATGYRELVIRPR